MKKYGIYAACGSQNCAWLMRERSTLKDAVKEAYQISRNRYNESTSRFADTFIVGDNTGIVFDTNIGRIYITYCVDYFTVSDNVVGRISMIDQNRWVVKVGIIDEKIYDISKE